MVKVILLLYAIDRLSPEPKKDPYDVLQMVNEVDDETEDRSIRWMKKLLIGLGAVFVIVGVIRQWPIVEKSYMEFIQGDGYLSLMLGLIMIVLGISVRLLIGQGEK